MRLNKGNLKKPKIGFIPTTIHLVVLILMIGLPPPLLATISVNPDTNIPTDGWDGPGLGSAVIPWYLGWNMDGVSGDKGVTTDGGLTRAQVEAAIQAGFDAWSAIVDVQFVKVGDSDFPGSGCFGAPNSDIWDCDSTDNTFQINIFWSAGDHRDDFDFDGAWNPTTDAGSQFAHSWGPPDIVDDRRWQFYGNIHLDDDENWVTSNATNVGGPGSGFTSVMIDIQSEITHEIGHSLGLAHPPTSINSIMEALSWNLEDRNPTAYDITEIRKLYAPASSDPGVVLLFDLSGSMSWSPAGLENVPVSTQRITYAKQAATAFLDLLNTYGSNQSRFAVLSFSSQSGQCMGRTHTGFTNMNDTSLTDATGTIMSLSASGKTPLIAGLEHASTLFTNQVGRSIVLLSDGYHNCPTEVNLGDPEVSALINTLNSADIAVHSIGFGRPSDPDYPLLSAFASATGGAFYNVTSPGFEATDWVHATALQSTYKSILVDVLNLETAVDPLGTISKGQVVEKDIMISPHEAMVSFILTWQTPSTGKLTLDLIASDNQRVDQDEPGVMLKTGIGYTIITVDSTFLSRPDKVGSQPWKMKIRPYKFTEGETQPYHYSVIMKSDLKLRAVVEADSIGAGSVLTVRAQMRLNHQPIKGLKQISVEVLSPESGVGNWFANNKITAQELNSVPATVGTEKISDITRKAIYLQENRNLSYPGLQVSSNTITLYDDGTHGDLRVNDGMYTNQFSETRNIGQYKFRIRVKGELPNGYNFQREKTVEKSIPLLYSPQHSQVTIKQLDDSTISIHMTVKDKLANHLGPGHAYLINVSVPNGQQLGSTIDNLDGSYTQQFKVTGDLNDLHAISVVIGGVDHIVTWSKVEQVDNTYKWLAWLLLFIIILLLIFIVRRKHGPISAA